MSSWRRSAIQIPAHCDSDPCSLRLRYTIWSEETELHLLSVTISVVLTCTLTRKLGQWFGVHKGLSLAILYYYLIHSKKGRHPTFRSSLFSTVLKNFLYYQSAFLRRTPSICLFYFTKDLVISIVLLDLSTRKIARNLWIGRRTTRMPFPMSSRLKTFWTTKQSRSVDMNTIAQQKADSKSAMYPR